MAKDPAGKQAMTHVTLHPEVRFGGAVRPTSDEVTGMHHEAHEQCYIASSVKTEVRCEPVATLT
jgi:organic hydroperoxide reductase OsmC/OhrA